MRADAHYLKSQVGIVTVGELRVSPWLAAPGMEHEQLERGCGFGDSPTNALRSTGLYASVLYVAAVIID